MNRYLLEFSFAKNPRMCDPILVILLKMQPNKVNPGVKIRPHAAGPFPLASYKEVPSTPLSGPFKDWARNKYFA